MFFTGHFADKTDLRMFLAIGMLVSGVFTVAFPCGYWFGVHSFLYFVLDQIPCSISQSTGCPCVVVVVMLVVEGLGWWGHWAWGRVVGWEGKGMTND